MYRALLSVAATSLAAFSLAACTSQTQSCSGGKCDIDISGKGSTVQLGGDGGSDLELVSASGDTAKVKIAGQEVELKVGAPLQISNASLSLVKVEGTDDIQLQLVGSGEAPSGGDSGGSGESDSGDTTN